MHKAVIRIKLDIRVMQELTQTNLMNRVFVSESADKRNKIESFLKRMASDDEKWFTCDNVKRKST